MVAPFSARGRTLRLAVGLVVVSLAIALSVVFAILSYRKPILDAIFALLFPEGWARLAGALLDTLLEPRLFDLVSNASIVLTLTLTSLLLMGLRERLSVAFELDAKLSDEPPHDAGLVAGLVEGLKALLVVVVLQVGVFMVGYTHEPSRLGAARVLSYVVLFATAAMDFVPPIIARHGHRNSSILLALARRPIASLGFGGVVTLPSRLLAQWSPAAPLVRLCIAIGAGAALVAWATLAGTIVGARILADRPPPRSPAWLRAVGWVTLTGALAFEVYVFGAIGKSLSHKLATFKCHYHVPVSSLSADVPSVGALVLRKTARTTVRFMLEIENPTTRLLEVEDSRVVMTIGDDRLGELRLSSISVAAGAHLALPVSVPVELALAQARRLVSHDGLEAVHATLFVRVSEQLEIPIYLR